MNDTARFRKDTTQNSHQNAHQIEQTEGPIISGSHSRALLSISHNHRVQKSKLEGPRVRGSNSNSRALLSILVIIGS